MIHQKRNISPVMSQLELQREIQRPVYRVTAQHFYNRRSIKILFQYQNTQNGRAPNDSIKRNNKKSQAYAARKHIKTLLFKSLFHAEVKKTISEGTFSNFYCPWPNMMPFDMNHAFLISSSSQLFHAAGILEVKLFWRETLSQGIFVCWQICGD